MTQARSRPLHFDVSSGLKSVLGSELITSDQVAIFELVKNSFDADAKRVHIYFGDNTIIVADNGKGMSYQDIKTKWLFVAYSSKRDANNSSDFRDDVLNRQHFAGSKGIGRFSSDRLGETVTPPRGLGLDHGRERYPQAADRGRPGLEVRPPRLADRPHRGRTQPRDQLGR